MVQILVDADGCPVKEEVYRVALRYKLQVTLVANTWMRAPQAEWLAQVVVGGELNAADDWIAERADADAIVITGDIPLAARCLAKNATVLDTKGGRFTDERIGHALASRELMAHLRDSGFITSGPTAFDKRKRSLFLQSLDQAIQKRLRAAERRSPAPDE